MPPKRKVASESSGAAPLLSPDRNNWPGWVELESEPALFNILLKDMGVRGVAISEIASVDDDTFMYMLPQPIHGLIFLFQYNDADHATSEPGKHVEDVWFANQVPEYACATIAILNLVNNIPGLNLGKELSDFKDFTQGMDPLMRGDTIDSFDFVKRVHNSFARENDMLNADMVTQAKVKDARKLLSKQKARATKEAKKSEKETIAETSVDHAKASTNGTGRLRQPTARQAAVTAKATTQARKATVASDPSDSSDDSFHGYELKIGTKVSEGAETSTPPRRSGRVFKPRKITTAADYEAPNAGYHYVAYVPIDGHVWKLDGMDRYQQDLGVIEEGVNGVEGATSKWLHAVTPMIKKRMQQSGDNIGFCLMAVVRDPYFDELGKLMRNVKTLQAVDLKLGCLDGEWQSMEGGETRKDVITGTSIEFEIKQKDIHDAELPSSAEDIIANEDDLIKLIEYRQVVLKEQTMLRTSVRDAKRVPKEEEEDSRLRKHDYGPFVKGWLSTLAEENLLQDLLD